MAYKIQNRTATSRRVRVAKNGGSVSFVQTTIPSFIENKNEFGFCLTAITPLPARENPTRQIILTAHPMGSDGRVSLYVDGVLTTTLRYTGLNKISDRQSWFNQLFSGRITYSGTTTAIFTSETVDTVYRVVFEDDDLDFVFNDFGSGTNNLNPTLIVEQYRLAFDLKMLKRPINCDGAVSDTGILTLDGDYLVEVDGRVLNLTAIGEDDLIALLESQNLTVTKY